MRFLGCIYSSENNRVQVNPSLDLNELPLSGKGMYKKGSKAEGEKKKKKKSNL